MAGGMEGIILDLGNVLVFHDNALLFRKLGERAGLEGAEVVPGSYLLRQNKEAVHPRRRGGGRSCCEVLPASICLVSLPPHSRSLEARRQLPRPNHVG
jgi:hypothetical protein